MSTFLPPALAETFNDTGGAGLVGCLLAMGVYGITTSQTYYYFAKYPKDKRWLKLFVCSPFLIRNVSNMYMFRFLLSGMADSIPFLHLFHLIYHYLIQNAFNLLGLIQNTWSLAVRMCD
ncbi:hypothetical protein B0H14DRAFT_2698622 [Mycena olivaceomarginata]|nr:hypothetical protein B0H14DRAFT_2698622 [Mycena olivaceomarginata]